MRQPWAWALEKSLTRPSFFCIFEKSGKNETTDLAVSQRWGSTIAIISAHVPGPNIWASAGPGPSSSSSKQCKLDGHVKIYNFASARSPLTKSKKKKYREHSNIKSSRVSALTGSVPHNMAEALQKESALIRNRTHVTRLFATRPNHEAINSYQMLKINSIWLVEFRHLQPICLQSGLLYSDFSSWISRPDTIYEKSWMQTFDRWILSHST